MFDVDGNRYVDLAAGFGSLILGHGHPRVMSAVAEQSHRMAQALGDVFPSDVKVQCAERIAALFPSGPARVIFGQSGADAVTAALKTAMLVTGKPGWIAFRGAYHGLSYAPLGACGLRPGYRAPFAAQLNPRVCFVDYPAADGGLDATLEQVEEALKAGDVGALIVEPILGRGGCVVPPSSLVPELAARCRTAGALVIVDEIWTGLGRSGRWLYSDQDGFFGDLVCLGKGLGGGIPISACVGRAELLEYWSREDEVVHTSTFSGAPLACAAALETLEVIEQENLVNRADVVGTAFCHRLGTALAGLPAVAGVRGAGLMVAVELKNVPGGAVRVQQQLLRRGYIVSTGGGRRDVLVMTPPLTVNAGLLEGVVAHLASCLHALAS